MGTAKRLKTFGLTFSILTCNNVKKKYLAVFHTQFKIFDFIEVNTVPIVFKADTLNRIRFQ